MQRYAGILNEGSLAGLAAFAWFLLLYFAMGAEYALLEIDDAVVKETFTIRVHPFGSLRMLGVVIPIIFMYRSIKRFKIEEGEGFITYARAFRVGVMFTFIYASLAAMLVFLFGSLIDGSFVEFANTTDVRLLEITREADNNPFLSLIDIDEQIELMRQRDLADFALGDFWQKTTSGFIIALILAAFLKQKPPTFATDE